MADSIPSLRRKLDEANAEISRLSQPTSASERVVYITDPDLIAANQALKERVCQLESLLASEPAEEK